MMAIYANAGKSLLSLFSPGLRLGLEMKQMRFRSTPTNRSNRKWSDLRKAFGVAGVAGLASRSMVKRAESPRFTPI